MLRGVVGLDIFDNYRKVDVFGSLVRVPLVTLQTCRVVGESDQIPPIPLRYAEEG